MAKMTPRQRVEAALQGEWADQVPFTIYANKLPRCQVELELRNAGVCVLERRSVVRAETPNVRVTSIGYEKGGVQFTRRVFSTPRGELSTIERPGIGTTWRVKRMFTRPEDYAPLLALIKDQRYVPDFETFQKMREDLGQGAYLRAGIGYSPLQEIIYTYMGVECFSIEWAERRDEVMRLYDALTEDRRKIYPLLAESPAEIINYGGNVSVEVVGKDRFERFIIPHYNEVAEIVHKRGKMLGSHLDGNNRQLAPLVANSLLDYVEAFTPPPDCDMTVAEARELWKGKVLWINFPSSVHLSGVEAVENMMHRLLREAAPGDRFLVGVTEDVHEDAWRKTFPAMARILNESGRLPLER